ncbi:hypothetical protein [Actinophytocola glycyrrhizae]|uniref:Lipoprotein n=1 Tax=Actinophytocola glycyrrhizae TaxID=2044873 RepID=A0ABV9S2Z9_9PSEU
MPTLLALLGVVAMALTACGGAERWCADMLLAAECRCEASSIRANRRTRC